MIISEFVSRCLDRIIMFLRNMVSSHTISVQSYPMLTMQLLAEKCWSLIRSGELCSEDAPKRLFFVEVDLKRMPADICNVPDKKTVGLMVLTNKEGVTESVSEILVWDGMDEVVAQHLKEGNGAIELDWNN